MLILSDIHCNFNRVIDVCSKTTQTVLQLGDFGSGFMPTGFIIQNSPKNLKFFCGNHDNRTEARKIPNCVGDYGELENVFFVSGANSRDKDNRIEGVSWWPDEELTYEQGNDCLALWASSGKKIIVSHDTTQSFVEQYLQIYDRSLTRNLLQSMIEVRKPELLIFGHHHRRYNVQSDGIHYVGLPMDAVYEI